jgi:hypothetical protein
MPQITIPTSPNGLVISVVVGVSVPRQAALTQAGQRVPDAVPVRALVDTGASCTLIDKTILGMDILRRGILIYNGEADQFTMAF